MVVAAAAADATYFSVQYVGGVYLGLMFSKAPLEVSGGSPCPPKMVPPSLTGIWSTYNNSATVEQQ